MKKMKWTLMSLAIIISVCGAFVTRPKFDCTQATQYYFTGGAYMPAGTYGVNYICEAGTTTCTYYTTNGITFFTCQIGSYTPGGGLTVKNPEANPSPSNSSH